MRSLFKLSCGASNQAAVNKEIPGISVHVCKSAVQYSCSKEIPDNHGSPRTHTCVISRADNNPTEDPVHLQDPQHPFQHHKPHVFLPLTALNMDTNPAGCFLPVYCRSCSFQSKTQFCAPSLLSHSFFTHICSAEFHPPAIDVQTRSPAQCPCQPKMEAPLLCHS